MAHADAVRSQAPLLRRRLAPVVPQDRRPGDGRAWRCPSCLRAEASGRAAARSHKSVIMVYLSGGLSHQDTFDLKPDAPDGDPRRVQADRDAACPASRSASCCRGSPAIDRQARRAPLDRRPARRAFELPEHDRLPDGRRASARGSRTSARSIAKVQGPVDPVVPPFVDLFPDDAAQAVQHARARASSAWRYRPARMDGDDLALLEADRPSRPTRFDRPHAAARRVRPVPPRRSTAPRSAAWTASTAGPSTS